MGEIFERAVAASPAGRTGEGLTSVVGGQREAERHHRYLLARALCRGREVLDLGAGEGYGAAMLAQVARRVVACDIDPAPMQAARSAFPHPTLDFVAADARALPILSGSVDVVVCFEALEHVLEQEALLSEIRRVLRFGGLLLLSTTEREIASPAGAPANPSHRRELTRGELLDLVGSRFAHVALARQRAMVGSVILPEGAAGTRLVFERRGDTHYEADADLPRAPYLLCMASDQALPALPVSLLVLHDDVDAAARLDAARSQAEAREAAARQQVGALAQDLQTLTAERLALEQRLQQAETEAGRLVRAMTAVQAERDQARQDSDAARAAAAGARHEWGQAGDRLARARMQAAVARQAAAAARQEVQGLTQAQAAARLRELATEDRLATIERSTTWRATARLRRFGSRHPWTARQLRRTLLLLSWARRGELQPRLAAWWAARAGAPTVPALPAPLVVPAGLVLPASDAPEVSVIIPSFGQAAVTLRCLVAIANSETRCALEVLVADDASDDPEVARLAVIPGLRLLRNAANLGFLRNVNAASAQARGRYLLFLNNDTEIRPGAIDALLALLQARPDAGLVGAKLVYPDGRLQEAGGIIWADGSGWNYGHAGDPAAPEFNYVREVDYCSAAAAMLPAALFADLGGFDERYAPAYCEDSDLAFRIREHGLKVLYQPRAVVVHHEGLSHGTDIGAGIKAHQVTNQQTLRERWSEVLRREHFPNGVEVMRARDRARGRMLCLMVDHYVPEPDRDAGSGSMVAFIRTLQEAGWVVKFWPDNQAAAQPYTEALQQAGVEVICGPPHVPFSRWIAANGASLDHVLLSRPTVAPAYLPAVGRHAPQAAVSFYGHDLHAVRMRREAALSGDAALAARAETMARTERQIWRSVDAVLYPSEVEAETVRQLEPSVAACAVTPYRYAVLPPREAPTTNKDLLFVAGFGHPPNLDAAAWLVREIMPLVRAEIPQVRLALVGSNPSAAVLALAGEGVEVTGYVTDAELTRRYGTARAAVVPLRVGAGVKAKVVEALRAGLPLVTTTIGAEGLPGVEAVATVADEPAVIAAALLRLLRDDAAWMAASRAQSAYAMANFGAERMRETLLGAMAAAVQVHAQRVGATVPQVPGSWCSSAAPVVVDGEPHGQAFPVSVKLL